MANKYIEHDVVFFMQVDWIISVFYCNDPYGNESKECVKSK